MVLTQNRSRPAHRAAGGERRDVARLLGLKAGGEVRRDLEGLRAIAVLGVVVYHLRPTWLPGGFAGVDVFFVLSGFFITGLLLRETDRDASVDLLRFWGRRARRLLPASALVLVLTVAAGYLMTNPLESQRIARDGLWASVFGMNWHAAFQATDYLQDPDPSPLVHYWSLGVEEQFYLLWPLLLLGCALAHRAVRTLTPRRTLAVVAVVGGATSFLLALHQTMGANSFAYFGTMQRAWQLLLGALLAVLAGRWCRLPAWASALSRYAGVALVLGFYVAASTGIVYPGRKALVPALGAALIVVAGPPRRTRDPLSRVLCSWPAQLGGRYSYSWYLWHYPPLVLLPIALARPLTTPQLVLCAAGTLAAAVVTYHLLENPVRSSRWLARRHGGRSLALGGVLVALALGAAQWSSVASTRAADHAHVSTAAGQVLRPQPAVAAHEQIQPIRDGCQVPFDDKAHLGQTCRYEPDRGHGDVALVGDSHAAMWFPAVDGVARAQGWGLRVFARDSCPFGEVGKTGPGGGPYTACYAWRADVLRRLVADRPSLVIVSSFDSVLHGTLSLATGARLTGQAQRAYWAQGLERSLRTLRAAGIRVLVIHDVPSFTTTAPDCVLAHEGNLAGCSLPQDQAFEPGPSDLTAAAAVPGVRTVDFTPTLCHGGRCYQVVDSTVAYRDQNHLTIEMARALQPRLAAAAVRAMTG